MINIDTKTLTEILGEPPREPSFLIDKAEKEEEQSLNTEQETTSSQEKQYVCSKCGEPFENLPELMRHSKKEHPHPKKEKKVEMPKEETSLTLIEDEIPTSIIETPEPKEIQEKPTRKKTPEITTIPNAYDRLSALLSNFGISNFKGVVDGMKFRDLADTDSLKELLLSVTTSRAKVDAIIQIWEEMYGKKKDIFSVTPTRPSTSTDALSLMAKLREEEINDSILDNYKAKLEEKKLDMEMKRKRLSGEYMDTNRTSPELEVLRNQLEQLREDKRQRETELLRQEISSLKNISQSPFKNTEIEALNQRISEMQRKSEEDARIRQMEENHRREIDSLKELIKQTQTSSQPKSEDILLKKIEEMQKSHEKEMQDFKTELLSNKREDELKHTIETLKEDIKENKDRGEGNVGQLASTFKDFATEITHTIDKNLLQRDHEKKEDELKKKIDDIERARTLTNEQYALEKGEKFLGKGIDAFGGFLDGFRKTLEPGVESAGVIDRAKAAGNLLSMGYSPEQATTILEGKTMMPRNPGLDSHAEYEKLQRSIGPPEQQTIPSPEPSKVKINVDNS